jgi:hypothetical protein
MIDVVVYQAVVELNPPLQISPACLGLALALQTREGSCTLVLPVAHAQNLHAFLPPVSTPRVLRTDNGFFSDWARAQSVTTSGEIVTVRVDKVLLDWDGSNANSMVTPLDRLRFGVAFDDWYRDVHSWLDLWTDQGLSGLEWQTAGSRTSGVGLAPDGSSIEWGTNWTEVPQGLFNDRPPATPVDVQAAARLSSRGCRPSLSWQLIRRARATREPREQVIDAATAAEVAIEQLLVTRLSDQNLSSSQVEAILQPLTGIVEKLRVLEAFSPLASRLVKRVGHRIAGPRNRAAHAGQYPTLDEVKECIDAAVTVLDTYDPLPGP